MFRQSCSPFPTPGRLLARRAALPIAGAFVFVSSVTASLGGPASAAVRPAPAATGAVSTFLAGTNIDTSTIPELERLIAARKLSSAMLTAFYLHRIATVDPLVHAVLEVNPDATTEAAASDARRRSHKARPLEGIPVLLKDNVETHDKEHTTAGSLALLGGLPNRDAFLVSRLRAAGAVILGKANLSEWANFRSTQSSSGWSAVGGQTNNPYVLNTNPCGSSAGSAAGVAASLAQVAIGTETDGSIVCPSGTNGDVGLKPTLGLISRHGVVPISAQQDTAGPIARNVTDAAYTLDALTGVDRDDPATAAQVGHTTTHYEVGLARPLTGQRIGVWRQGVTGISPEADAVFNAAVAKLKALGATVVEGADLPGLDAVGKAEGIALNVEFKHDINNYLARLPGKHPRTLTQLIQFDRTHAAREMPFFGQETFIAADKTSGDETDPTYVAARTAATGGARTSIDSTLAKFNLNAIVALTNSPAWTTDLVNGDHFLLSSSTPAAVSGYPSVTVPAGYSHGLPVGISFMGTAWTEQELLRIAAGFERSVSRQVPTYLPSSGDTVHAQPRLQPNPAQHVSPAI